MENIIKNIKESNIWKYIHNDNNNIDNIMVYLKKKDIDYSAFDNLLCYIADNNGVNIDNINSYFIVSIIMIHKFADDIIGKNRVEEEDIIVYKANEIYNVLLNNTNKENIHKKIITFKILYDDWKNKDKTQQLDILSDMYYKYTKSIPRCLRSD